MALLIFAVPTVMVTVFRLEILDAFNDAGTFGAFGFLGAYFLISVAAPAYLKRRGQLGGRELALSVASVLLLMVPAVGSVYPVPPSPVNIFPYIFLGYLAIGLAWFMILRRRPDFAESLTHRIRSEHEAAPAAEISLRAAIEKSEKTALA
jgi:amino acid transporter